MSDIRQEEGSGMLRDFDWRQNLGGISWGNDEVTFGHVEFEVLRDTSEMSSWQSGLRLR